MIAEGVRDTDLAAYQRAARTLLVHPLVTATTPAAAALPLVRRFSVPLAADLADLAGYRLELAPTCARLVRVIDRPDVTQVVKLDARKQAFDRRRYAYLALVLAALGRAGPQVALTEVADAVRRRAAEIAGLGFDPDEYRHRLAFIDAVAHLVELGALRQVEASGDWVHDPGAGEALYDVDRDVVHLAFVPARVIQHVHSAGSLLAGATAASRDARRAETRRRLARLALEHPVVYLDDLDAGERAFLVSQARVLADDLARLTGGQLERRSEGVALIDATGGFSDRRFPAAGTPAQAALLLADAIADRIAAGGTALASVPSATEQVAAAVARLDAARPATAVGEGEGEGEGSLPSPVEGAEPTAGPFLPDAWLAEQAERLCATHGRAFAAELRNDPAGLATAALEVLVAFDLVRLVPGGAVARPALARYRDVQLTPAGPTQLSILGSPEAAP